MQKTHQRNRPSVHLSLFSRKRKPSLSLSLRQSVSLINSCIWNINLHLLRSFTWILLLFYSNIKFYIPISFWKPLIFKSSIWFKDYFNWCAIHINKTLQIHYLSLRWRRCSFMKRNWKGRVTWVIWKGFEIWNFLLIIPNLWNWLSSGKRRWFAACRRTATLPECSCKRKKKAYYLLILSF
jgi:hypothetical protein